MGVIRRSKTGYDSSLGMIAEGLRADGKDIAREPLPERWVDLINYLDEQERKRSEGTRPDPNEEPGRAGGGEIRKPWR